MESALLAKQCPESILHNSLPYAVNATVRRKARARIEEQYSRHAIARIRNEQFDAEQKSAAARVQKKAAVLAKLRSVAGGPIAVLVAGKITRKPLQPNTLITLNQYEEAACNSFHWSKEELLQQLRLRNAIADQRTETDFKSLSKLVPEITSRTHPIPLGGRKDAILKSFFAVLTAERNAQRQNRADLLQKAGIDDEDDDSVDVSINDVLDIDESELELPRFPSAHAAISSTVVGTVQSVAASAVGSAPRRSGRSKKPKIEQYMLRFD
jgi:hypothetical protein